MGEPDDYLIRVAAEERERRLVEDARRRAEAREDAWRAQGMAFEANKHLATLSLSALVLTVALSNLTAVDLDVRIGLFAFGIPLTNSLIGMWMASISQPPVGRQLRPVSISLWVFAYSATFFIIGAMVVVLLAST